MLIGIGEDFLAYLNVKGDIMGSMVMIVTGFLLFYGGVNYLKGQSKGIGFSTVGVILALLLTSVYILIFLSGTSVDLMTGEADIGLDAMIRELVPQIFLVIPIAMMGIPIMKVARKLKRPNTGHGEVDL